MDFNELLVRLQNGDFYAVAIAIVAGLILALSVFSLIIQIMLAIKYHKFNRKKNSIGKTGEQVAREILDKNGLQKIKVKCVGSFMFGNSYSHYFKKVRLRRLTWKKDSVTSLGMAAQKSALAVLDKEGDPLMKTRIVLTPIMFFGPFLFVPMVIVGIVLDIIIFNTIGWLSILFSGIGLGFYLVAFILALAQLKTEKRAQQRAYEILRQEGMATEAELLDLKELFRLYNIQYINDLIMALLELIYRILLILANSSGSSSSYSSSK